MSCTTLKRYFVKQVDVDASLLLKKVETRYKHRLQTVTLAADQTVTMASNWQQRCIICHPSGLLVTEYDVDIMF